MGLVKQVVGDRLEVIEDELEELSIQIIDILKEYKEKGIVGEEEYKKHTRHKEDFLTYLNNKRQKEIIK